MTGLHQPVHDFVQRAVAAEADHEGPPLAGGGGGQVRRLAGSGGRDDVELAQGLAQGAEEMRKVAAGAAATCGGVCDDEGAPRGAGVWRVHEGKVPDGAARVRAPSARAVQGSPWSRPSCAAHAACPRRCPVVPEPEADPLASIERPPIEPLRPAFATTYHSAAELDRLKQATLDTLDAVGVQFQEVPPVNGGGRVLRESRRA